MKGEADKSTVGEARKLYRDSVVGDSKLGNDAAEEEEDDGDASSDDVVEEGDDETWIGIGMTMEDKIEARRPWRNSLIIKLVGISI